MWSREPVTFRMRTGHQHRILWPLLCLIASTVAKTVWMSDNDLTSFVTRPELKVPILQVTKHLPELVTDGYIFMATYVRVDSEPFTKFYQPCQVGPIIWNLEGELIWSGACLFSNANPYDFKLNHYGGNATTLSLIVGPMIDGNKGRGVILGPSLEVDREVFSTNDLQGSYMHEFKVLDEGNTVLAMQAEYREVNVTALTNGNLSVWSVRDEGFRVIDLLDNSITFQWWAMDHIPIEETPDQPPQKDGDSFDVYHINSLERTAFGHYIISMRHTNTIYMVSGQDGRILWRLGGLKSSFVNLDSFIFSGQHDARIISEGVSGKIVMSFFDNGGTTSRKRPLWTAKVSSVLIVELDTAADPMTAKLLRRYERPDGGMTVLRGNAQILPDGNVIAGYSSSGYFAEFAEDGRVILEGHLASTRMSTYRTFKYGIDEVKLYPAEPIALVCRSVEAGSGRKSRKMSIMYVSWNGATEVTDWKFAVTNDPEAEGAVFPVVGTKKKKRGFETVAQLDFAGTYALVYGLDKDGNMLGKSAPVKCEDIVEAAYVKQEVDPKAFRKPPGSAGSFHATGNSGGEHETEQGQEGEGEPETGQEREHESEKEQESEVGPEDEQEREHESEDEQEASSEAPKVATGGRPPNIIGTDRALVVDTAYHKMTITLFLFVSLVGGLLLMKRFRRQIF